MEITARQLHESAKEYVARTLLDNIVHTRLEPGQKLQEQALCAQLQVSRTPLREAMLELAQRQLIEIRPKIGSYVSLIDPAVVEQVRHLRSVLETELAEMACTALGQPELDRLWENIALWRMCIERQQEARIFQLDKEFHRLLYEGCGRMYWYTLVESAAPHFDRTTILSFRCRPMEHILDDHEQLVRALEARDVPTARRLASRHMERYCENLDAIRARFPQYFVP